MLSTLLPLFGLAVAAAAQGVPQPAGLIPRQAANTSATTNATSRHASLLVGAAGQIRGFDFDGKAFVPKATVNVTEPGKAASWMIFKEPNLLYAVDENGNATRLFNYDKKTGVLSQELRSFNGSSGVVHLAFNDDKTILVGSSYGLGQVDIWDSAAADGSLKLIKQVPLPGTPSLVDKDAQKVLRAHGAVLDPTGQYFIINDLGGDKLHILDIADGKFAITESTPVTPAGSGPRHGAFLTLDGGKKATHYIVVCELTNTIQMFSVSYENGLKLTGIQTISTFGAAFPPANVITARAGELVVSGGTGPAYVYVSNRLTGNFTDSISRFAIEAKSQTDKTPQLVFKGFIETGGLAPRMFSFSKDDKQQTLFVANVNGEFTLQAHERCNSTVTTDCQMGRTPMAKFAFSQFSSQPSGQGFGAQFVMDVTPC
ncbi:hypothetical protein LTR64_004947 [Lithohypha guttulata]|uniref:uncharacterized protein n=1 Tax=Lithohypha guttulata TaxID=1690604 RepID=UPI002DDFDE5A|nr:hypothetical protein LTR51_005216 [Lithohypha guttulata]